jgi:RND family efflux transporter MFP subunit
MRLQFVIVALLAAALAGGWWWYAGGRGGGGETGGDGPKTARAATPVLIEPLSLAADRVTVRAIGTSRARRSAVIYPAVSGEVVAVAFTAEQRVKRGQPLLRLDDKHQRLAVRLAEVAVKEARRHLERLERLAPSGAASRARLQTAEAELESAELRLDQAKADLSDRTVFAPFDGVVGLSELDPGDRVTEETMVTTLDDRATILVEFAVPEDYAGGLKLGDPVIVRPWSARHREIRGVATALGSRIDETTRSLTVRAEIANPDDAIRPGSSFEVQFGFTGGNYPRVREVAVSWSRDGAYLWRVVDGKAERVFVRLVRRERGHLLVEGPLREGDNIVVEGVQGLRPGLAVAASPFQAAAAEGRGAKGKGS